MGKPIKIEELAGQGPRMLIAIADHLAVERISISIVFVP